MMHAYKLTFIFQGAWQDRLADIRMNPALRPCRLTLPAVKQKVIT